MLSVVMSGLNAAQKELEVTSNNIANAGTVGFKSSEASFADVFANDPSADPKTAIGSGVIANSVMRSTSQGSMSTTGNVTDLAIAGSGFFTLGTPGDTPTLSYTRAGSFGLTLGPSMADPTSTATPPATVNSMVLTSTGGLQVQCFKPTDSVAGTFPNSPPLGTDPAGPIQIPQTCNGGALSGVSVSSDGTVSATYADANNTKLTIGMLKMANFAVPSALKAIGNTNFTQSQASGSPRYSGAGAPNSGEIMSGTLEQSNVDMTQSLMQMIKAQQIYNGNARMLQTAVEIGSRITDKL